MSTKIYNAYKYHGSIQSLMKDLFLIKNKYWEQCAILLEQYYSDRSLNNYLMFEPVMKHVSDWNKKSLNKLEPCIKEKPLDAQSYAVLDILLKAFIKKGTNDPLNFEASAVVYPYGKSIYIQFFGMRDLTGLSSKKFSDFHYQDQTDRDSSVNSREWSHRKRVWNKIYDEVYKPGAAGLAFSFIEACNCFEFCYWLERVWKQKNSGGKIE